MKNKFLRFKNSLPVRAGFSVFLISVLAITTTLTSGLIAWVSEQDGSAINYAGSIRMASYHIGMQVVDGEHDLDASLNDMQTRFNALDAYQSRWVNQNKEIDTQLDSIKSHWQEVSTWLVDQQRTQTLINFEVVEHKLGVFVTEVNQFVLRLQKRNEHRQSMQQLLQGSALLIMIIIMLVGLYELHQNVLAPVQELKEGVKQFKQGDLGVRMVPSGYQEFMLLVSGFNDMAATIENNQVQLESRVAQQTAHLSEAYQALYLLYEASQNLASEHVSVEFLNGLITDFGSKLNHIIEAPDEALNITLCLNPNPQQTDSLNRSSIALHDAKPFEICGNAACSQCRFSTMPEVVNYPINYQDKKLGQLRVQKQNQTKPNQMQNDLLKSLANLVSTALILKDQRKQEHQLILFNERSIIARELHDSLAQSLSYLKIQIALMESLLNKGAPLEKQLDVSADIKNGLNNAYRQLRELLTTFRLKVGVDGFDDAVNDAAEDFAARGNFVIQVKNTLPKDCLNANEQIHVLQIIREALSNCARHAHAEHVTVGLYIKSISKDERDDKHHEYVQIHIQDDGVGMKGDYDTSQHHGMVIIHERGKHLDGKVSIDSKEGVGTSIILTFTPTFFASDRARQYDDTLLL